MICSKVSEFMLQMAKPQEFPDFKEILNLPVESGPTWVNSIFNKKLDYRQFFVKNESSKEGRKFSARGSQQDPH